MSKFRYTFQYHSGKVTSVVAGSIAEAILLARATDGGWVYIREPLDQCLVPNKPQLAMMEGKEGGDMNELTPEQDAELAFNDGLNHDANPYPFDTQSWAKWAKKYMELNDAYMDQLTEE